MHKTSLHHWHRCPGCTLKKLPIWAQRSIKSRIANLCTLGSRLPALWVAWSLTANIGLARHHQPLLSGAEDLASLAPFGQHDNIFQKRPGCPATHGVASPRQAGPTSRDLDSVAFDLSLTALHECFTTFPEMTANHGSPVELLRCPPVQPGRHSSKHRQKGNRKDLISCNQADAKQLLQEQRSVVGTCNILIPKKINEASRKC